MAFIFLPMWIAMAAAAVIILFRVGWPVWVRIPGCLVIAPVAGYLGMVVVYSVMIGALALPTIIDWLWAMRPWAP